MNVSKMTAEELWARMVFCEREASQYRQAIARRQCAPNIPERATEEMVTQALTAWDGAFDEDDTAMPDARVQMRLAIEAALDAATHVKGKQS